MKQVLLITLLVVLVGCNRHKAPDPHDPYRDVPERDRESLRVAVQHLVKLQKIADWEKMYEITEEPREAKDRFIRRRSAARALRDFVPTVATWVPDGWVISGCGVYESHGQPEMLVSSLHARPNPARRGEWFFSAVAVDIVPGEPGNVKSCGPFKIVP